MKIKEFLQIIPTMLRNSFRPLITGQPGVGKSQVSGQACDIAFPDGYKLFLLHPSISDPTDFKGLPAIVNGEAEFLPIGDMRRLCEKFDVPVVALVDDLGQAPHSVQAALMQPIEAGEIGGHKISPNVRWIAATNRAEDRAGVRSILAPLLSRFHTIIEMEPSAKDWADWAMEAGLPADLISYCLYKPSFIEAGFSEWLKNNKATSMENFPCPRTIERIGRMVNAGINPDTDGGREVIYGAAGKEFGSAYYSFRLLRNQLPKLADIISNPASAKVPTMAGAQYAAVSMCVENVGKKIVPQIKEYIGRYGKEFEILAFRMILGAKKDEIVKTKEFRDWILENQAYIN